MSYPIQKITELYFRFIENTELKGKLDAQKVALILSREGFIDLVPHRFKPTIEHYRKKINFTRDEALDLLKSEVNYDKD